MRVDGTPEPEPDIKNKVAGRDYVLQAMVRRKSDALFLEDLKAVEGGVYVVKCTQLVFNGGQLKPGSPGTIVDPKGSSGSGGSSSSPDDYPEAVIAFSADFFAIPSRSNSYFASGGAFNKTFAALKKPIFTRNLAVLEALHNALRCRVIFATHFHELARLSELPHLRPHTMRVKEWKQDVVFLHEVAEGSGGRSWGVHVARLAGVPAAVVKRATICASSVDCWVRVRVAAVASSTIAAFCWVT